jgi:hypothetical protein
LSRISSVIDFTSSFDFDLNYVLTPAVWSSLCRHFSFPVSVSGSCTFAASERSVWRCRKFRFEPSSPLSGIISHLGSTRDGNVSDVGVVKATANSTFDSTYLSKFATEMTTERGFGFGFGFSDSPGQ